MPYLNIFESIILIYLLFYATCQYLNSLIFKHSVPRRAGREGTGFLCNNSKKEVLSTIISINKYQPKHQVFLWCNFLSINLNMGKSE